MILFLVVVAVAVVVILLLAVVVVAIRQEPRAELGTRAPNPMAALAAARGLNPEPDSARGSQPTLPA
jgi:hypothetical protein